MPKEHSEVRVVLETLDFFISEQHAGDLEFARDARVCMPKEYAGHIRDARFFNFRAACRRSRIMLEMLECVCPRSTQDILVILEC